MRGKRTDKTQLMKDSQHQIRGDHGPGDEGCGLVEIVDGAFGADEYQDDRFLLLELGQRNGLALGILQSEVRDGLAGLSARRVGV